MVDAYENNVKACYLRIIVINPLHENVPSVIVMLQATCNRFTAEDVDVQWTRLRELWQKHLRPVLGVLIGPGSDGDERRFSLQRGMMTSTAGKRYTSAWRGFRLTAMYDEHGDVIALCAQDSFHCSKKLEAPMAVSTRDFCMGKHLARWYHIALVGDPDLFDPAEHGMRQEDAKRKDPMSVATVQKTASKKVRACLRRLQNGIPSKRDPSKIVQEDVVGTEVWLEVVSMFLRVFFSKKDSLGTRIKLCAAVVSFCRLKRHWIANDRSYTLGRNSESRQAFQHAVMQLESAALKIQRRCERNKKARDEGRPLIPVCLSKSGSDPCESTFSKLGGYGAVQLNRRNFNADDVVEMAGDLLQLAQYEFDPDQKLVFTRANRNLGIDMTDIEEDPSAPDADMCEVLTHDDIRREGEAGLALAHELARKVGMHLDRTPLPQWWHRPWVNDSKMDGRMREADEEDNIVDHGPTGGESGVVGNAATIGESATFATGKVVVVSCATTSDSREASITEVCDDGTYAVAFSDGSAESGVTAVRIRPSYDMREQDDADDVRDEARPERDFIPRPEPEPEHEHESGAAAESEPEAAADARRPRLAKPPARERPPTRQSEALASMRDDGDGEDAVHARFQLRDLYDGADQAAEIANASGTRTLDVAENAPEPEAAGGDSAQADQEAQCQRAAAARVSAHVTSPHGVLHKQTANTYLYTASSRGEKLTSERIGRAAQAAKLASLGPNDNSAIAGAGLLSRGTDVCCFFKDQGKPTFAQCGRVSALYDAKGRELIKPVPFETRAGLKIVGRWYAAADDSGLRFSYSEDDSSRYDATCVAFS